MYRELEKIIDTLKLMPLLEGAWENIGEEQAAEKFAFYKLDDGRSYLFSYFDESLENDPSKVAEKILSDAESALESFYSKYVARDTYVVFLSKIEKYSDSLQKFIIRIEENEFMFKKYVCLYTDEELVNLERALESLEEGQEFWANNNLIEGNRNLSSQLFLRLAIKIPIIRLNFAELQFNSIQNRVKNSIATKENKGQLEILNDSLIRWLDTTSPEEQADVLFKEIVGDRDEL